MSMVKIDERAVVPIGWVVSGFATMVSITAVGCFWISSVNYRLARIERSLGIASEQSTLLPPIEDDASAAVRGKHDANAKPVRGALQNKPSHD